MKVVSIKKFGGPEVLEVENIEIRKPKSKEVLIKNLSIGLNFIDTYHRTGLTLFHYQVVLDLRLVVKLKKLDPMLVYLKLVTA